MPTIEQARTWYPTSDPVHGFDHILRVLGLAEKLALAEGADLEIVRAAALLHDAEPPNPADAPDRQSHHTVSANFAAEILEAEGWPEERIAAVQHAIRAHRFRDRSEPPVTLEAQVLFDADKLDAIGAVGAARAIAYAVSRGQPAFARPSERFLASGQFELNEPHSAYHEYLFKLARIRDRLHTPAARRLAGERHSRMVAFFEQLAEEAG